MGFADLRTEGGLKELDDYLADRSYMEGYQPSQADALTFRLITTSPSAKHAHVLRWYNHIRSYGDDIKSFPAAKNLRSLRLTDAAPVGDSKVADSQASNSKHDSETKPAGDGGDSKQDTTKDSKAKPADDDEDLDLFGSDDEPDEAAEKLKEERLKQYAEKKSKKAGTIAKSSVALDIKPWDDETDMAEMEKCVRSIECDGLKWGAAHLVPLAYGIKKLQIMCVVEDEKVSIDWLQEEIEKFEDHVQSVDIAAFQKI